MTKATLQALSDSELVAEFLRLALLQSSSIDDETTSRYNRLYHKLQEVELELKSRTGDKRRELVQLFGHRNWQVRLMAAWAALAVEPTEARTELAKIKESKQSPQAANAGLTLRNLESGFFKPT